MFALIIAVVSIALIVATVVATSYFGGDVITQGRNGAQAAQLINEAQQVSAALTIARSDGWTDANPLATLNDLVAAKYLVNMPNTIGSPMYGIDPPKDFNAKGSLGLVVPLGSTAWAPKAKGLCEAINKQVGQNLLALSARVEAYMGYEPTGSTKAQWDALPTRYGCANGDMDSDFYFFYKF